MALGQGRENLGIAWLVWLFGFSLCLVVMNFPETASERGGPDNQAAPQEKKTLPAYPGQSQTTSSEARLNQSAPDSGRCPVGLLGPQYPGLLSAPDVNASAIAINNRGQVIVEEKVPEDLLAVATAPPTAPTDPDLPKLTPVPALSPLRITPDPEAVKKKIADKQLELCDETTFKAMLSRYEAELASKNFSRRANQLPENGLSDLIKKYARMHGVDARLVWSVIRNESGFNPQAVSFKGAMGLMQLIPSTAALMGVSDPFNVEENISGGVKYLKLCLAKFNNNVVWALAAYNAGPDNVSKYQGCPPFAETRNYVLKVMRDYTGNVITIPFPFLAAAGRLDKHGKTAKMASVEEAPQESGLDWKIPEAKFKVAGPNWKLPLRPSIVMTRIPAAVRQNPEVARLLAKQTVRSKLLP